MIYDNFSGIRDPLKQNLALQFCSNWNKEIIGWAPSFPFLEIVTQKDCFSCFIWVLKVPLRLALIQKDLPLRSLVSFKVTPSNDRVLCVYAIGTAPGNSCLEGLSLSKAFDVSSLRRLESSLDIFFLLGILRRKSVVAALEVVSLV